MLQTLTIQPKVPTFGGKPKHLRQNIIINGEQKTLRKHFINRPVVRRKPHSNLPIVVVSPQIGKSSPMDKFCIVDFIGRQGN
jgi:hypothetical protein